MHILGIDLAIRSFDATLLREGGDRRHKQFANILAGFRELQDWLTTQHIDRVHACGEQSALLTAIAGIGAITAYKLLAEFYDPV